MSIKISEAPEGAAVRRPRPERACATGAPPGSRVSDRPPSPGLSPWATDGRPSGPENSVTGSPLSFPGDTVFPGTCATLRIQALTPESPSTRMPGMPSKGRMFAGCTVALVTPFRDGEVDYPALQQLV